MPVTISCRDATGVRPDIEAQGEQVIVLIQRLVLTAMLLKEDLRITSVAIDVEPTSRARKNVLSLMDFAASRHQYVTLLGNVDSFGERHAVRCLSILINQTTSWPDPIGLHHRFEMSSTLPLLEWNLLAGCIHASIGTDSLHHVYLMAESLQTNWVGHDAVDMTRGGIGDFPRTDDQHVISVPFAHIG